MPNPTERSSPAEVRRSKARGSGTLSGVVAGVLVLAACSGGATPAPKAAECMSSPTCPVSSQQTYLDDDRRAVQEYGASFPSEWGGFAFEDTDGRAVLVASFTARIDDHGRALRARLTFADRLRLARSSVPLAELERRQADVVRRLETAGVAPSSVGIGKDVIRVRLPSGAEALAEELRHAYGSDIDVTLGAELRFVG